MKDPFFTLDDFDVNGKTVLVRIDINAPYDSKTGKIEDSERINAHAQTLRELAKKGAKVVVLAHQGRAGDEDFTTLSQHAEFLSKHAKKKVKYVPDLLGPTAQKEIQKLKPGKILLLENVRFLSEETLELSPEEHAKSHFVRTLAPLAQLFVFDGFSVAHRSQCSVVGFSAVLPSCAGRVMQREYEGISKAAENAKHPNVYVLAGAKADDVFKLLKAGCESPHVDKLLTSGVIGQLCLIANGVDLGTPTMKFMQEQEFMSFVPKVQELLKKYPQKIELPLDLAVERHGKRVEVPVAQLPVQEVTRDIGSKTAGHYAQILKTAASVYVKGPVGVYEEPNFELGTRTVFTAVGKSKAFSLMGGGHTVSALKKFNIPMKKVGYVSLAGGALLNYLIGNKLPALEALKSAAARKS